jgi:hypothetical protein
MANLTFNDLVTLEPRLAELLTEARAFKPRPKFCANAVWYGYFGSSGLKDKLLGLVGWGRETPLDGATDAPREETLKSSEAYDVAYHTLYEALPDCRARCACQQIMQAMTG